MIASGMTPTASRLLSGDFTDVYFDTNTVLVKLKSTPIASIADFAGKIIGTQDGTIWEDLLRVIYMELETTPPDPDNPVFRIDDRDFIDDLMLSLGSGAIHAVAITEVASRKYIGNPRFEILGQFEILDTIFAPYENYYDPESDSYIDFYVDKIAVALPKGSYFREILNAIIKDLEDSGELAAMIQYWFVDLALEESKNASLESD
jgi:ABC-type amino acid transport substrate-binding protein